MIRPFEPTDKVILIDIFKLNTPDYFDIKEIEDYLEYLEKFSDTYLTIEHEGKIIGGAGYYLNMNDNSGRITWIFLHPDYSGLGLGRKTVEYCLMSLRKIRGVEKFVVTTSQLAYKFFEKFGFKTTRVEKDFWGQGLDLYEMEMQNM